MFPLPLRQNSSRVCSPSHAAVAPVSDRQTPFFHRLLTACGQQVFDQIGYPPLTQCSSFTLLV